jgi:HNH endonuclease
MLDLKNSQRSALIDDEDLPKVSGFRWHLTSNGYVGAMVTVNGHRKMVLLHRHLLNAPPKTHVDHLSADKLDNRRDNIRIVTFQINQVNRKRLNRNNTSGARGVRYVSILRKWRVTLMKNRRMLHIGVYETREMAIIARKDAEIIHYGETCPVS